MNRIFIFAVIVFIALLAWAPWMDGQKARLIVESTYREGGNWVRGADGNLLQDLNVSRRPFGWSATNYEGGVFVIFWGSIL